MYDVEYCKKDGRWKTFRFVYRQVLMSPYALSWVKVPSLDSVAAYPQNKPDKVTTFHTPYTPDAPYFPQPPEPEPFE